MANTEFQNTMLEATFAFARLALTNAILLNGAAATALLALLGTAGSLNRPPLIVAISFFGWGAISGGAASLFAYLGQRCDWELSRLDGKPEAVSCKARGYSYAASILNILGIIAGSAAYVLFFVGAVTAADGLR